MARRVLEGWATGQPVRVAKVAGRCHYWRGEAGRCPEVIQPGAVYVEGEMLDGVAGGFARERWCAAHFSPAELGE